MSLRVAAAAVILSVFAQSALAEKLVTVESKHGVTETLDRLAAALDQRGIKPVARVDHAAGAKAVGMELPPTEILIFGNPKLGTPLMQANPEIAIDLPLKVLAWQDKAGKVWVAYAAPDSLKARYGIADRDEVFKAMESALQALTKAASGQ
jgi:uncharacterized protein (DUF302 family)